MTNITGRALSIAVQSCKPVSPSISLQKMSADKKNAAKTRQYNKKQEKNLVCDEQLDYEVPQTDEGAEHWEYCSEESCGILTMLWLPKLLPKGFERQPFICGYCTAKKSR